MEQKSVRGEEEQEKNTGEVASGKPKYPVIDRNPPFIKIVSNFNTFDYLRFTSISGISIAVGYLSGVMRNKRGPSMVTGGLIGLWGGFMYAYQNSAGRLMGIFPNDEEKLSVEPLYIMTTKSNQMLPIFAEKEIKWEKTAWNQTESGKGEKIL